MEDVQGEFLAVSIPCPLTDEEEEKLMQAFMAIGLAAHRWRLVDALTDHRKGGY